MIKKILKKKDNKFKIRRTNFDLSKARLSGNDIKKIKISFASVQDIENWSYGEPDVIESFNYRSLLPNEDGIHSQVIFGSIENGSCLCGKYKKSKLRGIQCPICNVIVDSKNMRRVRFGHISLHKPVVHCWAYLFSNILSSLLGLRKEEIIDVVFYQKFLVIDSGSNKDYKRFSLLEKDLSLEQKKREKMVISIGAEGIELALKSLNFLKIKEELVKEIFVEKISLIRKKFLVKRLRRIVSVIRSKKSILNIIIKKLPILPAGLRPIFILKGGKIGISDLDNIYRRIMIRNKRVKFYKEIDSPIDMQYEAAIALQFSVDNLFENERCKYPLKNKIRIYKSLAHSLKGKNGFVRKLSLGKRSDFSARTVIIVGSHLKLHQCGVPKLIALELLKPNLIRQLIKDKIVLNETAALNLIERKDEVIWEILKKIATGRMVLINRPPSLHRLSIQAFEMVIIEGKALQLHPLVCVGYNADFDGDQVAIFLLMTPAAIIEAKFLMFSIRNIFSPANGRCLAAPIREMIMTFYYFSIVKKQEKPKLFFSIDEVEKALELKLVNFRDEIRFFYKNREIKTSAGKVLINSIIPEEFRNFEVVFDKEYFQVLIYRIYKRYGFKKTAEFLDDVKDFGFKYSAISGITISTSQMLIPSIKEQSIKEIKQKFIKIEEDYKRGLLNSDEKKFYKIFHVSTLVKKLERVFLKEISKENHLMIMSNSGARASLQQLTQLCCLKGLVSDPSGNIVEKGILNNFREGIKPFDYIFACSGSRKGSIDKSIRTATIGYLTRKSVLSCSNFKVIIEDCKTEEYEVFNLTNFKVLIGRLSFEEQVFKNEEKTSSFEVKKNEVFTKKKLSELKVFLLTLIIKKELKVNVRTIFSCKLNNSSCVYCYGLDLSTWTLITIGSSIGIIAAQSMSEPLMQSSMRTFHLGGIADVLIGLKYFYASENNLSLKIIEKVLYDQKLKIFYLLHGGKIKILTSTGKIIKEIVSNSVVFFSKNFNNASFKKGEYLFSINNNMIVYTSKFKGFIDYSYHFIKIVERVGYKKEICVLREKQIRILDNNKKVIQVLTLDKGTILSYDSGSIVLKSAIIGKKIKIFSTKGITGGLPKIQNILEFRKSQKFAFISLFSGYIQIEKKVSKSNISIVSFYKEVTLKTFINSFKVKGELIVDNGNFIKKGEKLTAGAINYSDYLKIFDLKIIRFKILMDLSSIYFENGISINRKHLEIMIKRLTSFVKIVDPGASLLFIDEILNIEEVLLKNNQLEKEDKKIIQFESILIGLTKVSLNSKSFLASASFQETSKVLSNAAIKASEDYLSGIEENLIVGSLLPIGTGFEPNILKKT